MEVTVIKWTYWIAKIWLLTFCVALKRTRARLRLNYLKILSNQNSKIILNSQTKLLETHGTFLLSRFSMMRQHSHLSLHRRLMIIWRMISNMQSRKETREDFKHRTHLAKSQLILSWWKLLTWLSQRPFKQHLSR